MSVVNMDCILGMRMFEDNSVDAVVTDPPYGLEFMGKEWDGADGFRRSLNNADVGRDNAFGRTSRTSPEYRAGHLFQEWCEAWAREAFRILKPGGHMLAFSGSRTYHRTACAIEDAGFEVRDQIMWIYGSGFPKSLDVSKALDKRAGAVREVVSEGKAVKRMIPGADQNATGSWIKDNGREFVPQVTTPTSGAARQWDGWGTALKPSHEPICVARKPLVGTVAANVLAHGTGALNIDACRVGNENVSTHSRGSNAAFPKRPGETTVEESGRTVDQREKLDHAERTGRWPANIIHDGSDEVVALFPSQAGAVAPVRGTEPSSSTKSVFGQINRTSSNSFHGDTGSAARFFYCAKTSKADRGEYNTHPTVKPTELMRWLVRLVTPPGGTVVDPFTGSGSTGKAAKLEGFNFIGFELDAGYCAIADRRIAETALP